MNNNNLSNIKNLLFNNLTDRQTIFKNTFWLTISMVVNRLLVLALVVYAARFLGAEGYGEFSFAFAFASLLMIFSGVGLPAIVTREFAGEEKSKEEFYSILSLKILLAVLTFILILLALFFTVSDKDTQRTIMALTFFLLINSFIGIFHSFFHARQKMEYEAWLEVLQSLMIMGFGLFVLFRFPSAENLGYAHFISALAALIFVLLFFHFKIFPLRIKWDFLVWKKFLIMSWPLALIGLFGMIYSYIDSVMLGYLGMIAETGWYNAAYRIVTASLVSMGLVGAAFYPALSKFSKESKEKFQKAWDYEVEIMIMLAVPLMVGGVVLAPSIIYSFYPFDFSPAILAFQILILTAGIIFLYRPFYDALIVLNQQEKTFWITVSGAAINIVLNLILIPKYSLYGAAAATLATHLFVLFVIIFLTKRLTFIQLPLLRIFLTFSVSAVSAGLMYFSIKNPLAGSINIFLLVFIGALVYLMIFTLLRKYLLLGYFRHTYGE